MALNPPVFNNAVYNGAAVLAFWRPAQNTGITVTGFQITVAGSDGSTLQTTINNPLAGFGSVATGKLSTSVTYTVQVCVMATGQPNACTQQYLLITTQPALQTVDYDGTEVRFSWTPVPNTGGQIGSYIVAIFPTGGGATTAITINNPQASSAVIPLGAPLTGTYAAQVTAQTTYGVGSATAATPFNTTLPAITSVVYTGTSILLSWNPPASPAVALNGYLLTAFTNDDGATFSQTISGGMVLNGSILVPYPLDPAKEYLVRVSATTATPALSSTLPVPINSQQPELLSVDYDGSKLAAIWRPIGYPATSVSSYILTAFSTSGGSPITATIAQAWASSGSINQPAFVANLAYQFQVAAQAKNGSLTASDAVPIFTAAPAVSAALYDGAKVAVSWNALAQGPPVEQYRVTVSSSQGSYSVAVPGTALQAEVAVGVLSQSVTWSVSLVAVAGRATATSAASILLAAQPVLIGVGYNGATVLASWNPPTQTGITISSYVIHVNGDPGFPSFTSTVIVVPQSSGTINLASPLNPSGKYQLQVVAQTANGINSATTPVALITQLPVVTRVDFDGAQATIEWTPVPPVSPLVSGYELKAYSDQGGQPSTVVYNNALLTKGTVPVTLGNLSWKVNVCALAGVVSGCATLPVGLVQSSPAMQAVSYIDGILQASWSSVTGATFYVLQVLQAGSAIAKQSFTATQGALALKLDSSHAYTVSVQAATAAPDSISIGPSTNLSVITVGPLITSVAYVPGTLSVQWQPVHSGLITGYTAFIFQGETQVASRAVSGGSANQAQFTSQTLNPQLNYAVRVQATGAAASGPLSRSSSAIVGAPTILNARYDGATLSVQWSRVVQEAVIGYLITLTPATGNAITINTATETSLDVPVLLDLGTTWNATVQPFGANATGPSSSSGAVMLPAIVAPAISQLSYDGSYLSIAWTRGSLPYLTGYTITLSTGASYQTGPETSLSVPLAPASANGVTVTIAGNSATRNTSASAAVAAIGVSPAISSVRVASSTVTVVWSVSNPPSNASYVGELLNGDTVIATANATATGVTFSAPAATGNYSVRGRIYSSPAAGPPGGAVAVLTLAPAIQFSSLSDSALTLSWTPPPIGGIAAYLITCGGKQFSTSQTSISVPITTKGLAGTSVTVAAMAPNSTGPAASQQIVPAYAIASGTYDGTTLHITLSGTPAPAPAEVWIKVFLNGVIAASAVVMGAPSGDVPIPVALPPGSAVSAGAIGVGAGSITPPGTPTSIPTTAPDGVSAIYDGSALHVSWSLVPDPGVTGYQVTVAGTQRPVNPVYVAGVSSATIPAGFDLPFSPTAKVTVQAAVNLGGVNLMLGPGKVLAPQLAGYLRAITVPASAQPPYIYRIGRYQTLGGISAANITEYLPNPFTQGTPTIPSGVGNIFQLAPSASGSVLPYQLTIDKSVWTTFSNAPVRSALRDTYRQFLVAVEQAGVTPWAIRLVRQIIAEALPQTFAETLYYRYGVWRDDTVRLLDLEPGLRLRISGALYQLISGNTRDPLNGFVSAGSESFDVAEAIPSGGGGTLPTGPARMLTMDSFLSLLYPGASNTAPEIVAGPIDFFRSANRQDYYRLFYPAAIASSSSTGSSDLTQNITLIGAPSWQVLEYVTDQYTQNGFFPPSGNYYSAYFRGHATLAPVLKLTLAGEQCWVAPGTTIRQMLCAIGLGVWQGPGGAGAIKLDRPVSSLYDEPFSAQTLRFEPVNLSETAIASQNPPSWTLDLPVCAGDVITVETGD